MCAETMTFDLKIGDTVELRNGKWATVTNTENAKDKNYPICIEFGINNFTYNKKGEFIGGRKEPLDIIKKVEFN